MLTRMRPSEVYLELGYGSLAAFSTEFKKHFGTLPSALRWTDHATPAASTNVRAVVVVTFAPPTPSSMEPRLPLQRTQQFAYYKLLGEKTFAQLSDEELFWQHNADTNSVATIVKHLWGNMRSRWTDFLTTDGEKDWRDREAEFENDVRSRGSRAGAGRRDGPVSSLRSTG